MRMLLSVALLCACGDDSMETDGGVDTEVDARDVGGDAPRVYEPEPFEPTEETFAYCPLPRAEAEAVEERITELLRTLSVEEKTAMMHGAGLLPVDGTWQVEGNAREGIPGLHMLDGPRGLSRVSDKNGTAFPVAMMRGATFDVELERRVGAAMAREQRSAGADVILAPTINILRHPLWGRAQETYSEDVAHLGAMGVAFIEGVQSEGVLASAKHFAANSIEDTRHMVDVTVDERTLREIYLPHFRRAVQEAHVASVMSAYNQVNGLYCDLNTPLLQDILEDEWGFQGFVESDWILGTHDDAASVRAGLDIEMPSGVHFRRLPARVNSGELDERELDRSVRRIVRAQLCFGLEGRERTDDPAARETPEHLALAREVAQRGLVLLRNEVPVGDTAALLPFAADASLVVVGPLAAVENIGDTGSSNVTPTDVVTVLEGLAARFEVTHVETADRATLEAADVAVVVVGLTAEDEGEATVGAGDRETLALSDEDRALVQAVAEVHDRVLVVVMGGATVLLDFADAVEGIVFAFYPGLQGGHALADVLTGDVAPSGRLPFTIPFDTDDMPAWTPAPEAFTYGYFHGYRHLQNQDVAPRYPFGFGLSYATFSYGPLALSSDEITSPDDVVEVTLEVTNDGSVRAIETVQLYVAVQGSRVERAPEDLRAFTQVALEPGETLPVTLTLPARDLMFWDGTTHEWVLEATDYELRASRHAGDPQQTATLTAL